MHSVDQQTCGLTASMKTSINGRPLNANPNLYFITTEDSLQRC